MRWMSRAVATRRCTHSHARLGFARATSHELGARQRSARRDANRSGVEVIAGAARRAAAASAATAGHADNDRSRVVRVRRRRQRRQPVRRRHRARRKRTLASLRLAGGRPRRRVLRSPRRQLRLGGRRHRQSRSASSASWAMPNIEFPTTNTLKPYAFGWTWAVLLEREHRLQRRVR